MDENFDMKVSLERLLLAINGQELDLIPEEELGRTWARRLYLFNLVLGLIVFYFFPWYALFAGSAGAVLNLPFLLLPPSYKLRKHFDPAWMEELMTISFPASRMLTSIGACHFVWSYRKLPLLRRITDSVIVAPITWPFTIKELIELREERTL